eukprot:Awhi_evm1s10669
MENVRNRNPKNEPKKAPVETLTLEAINASSICLQNTLGMICDPVANTVEAPCLFRNTLAAVNAVSVANMAMAGFDGVIPLDEVIAVHHEVGGNMPRAYRCTGLGGLAQTPTSKAIEAKMSRRRNQGGCGSRGCGGCGKGF